MRKSLQPAFSTFRASFALVCLLLSYAGPAAFAGAIDEGASVNLDSAAIAPLRTLSGRIDIRAFGSDENLTYTTLGVRAGLGKGWEADLRAELAGISALSTSNGGVIRHGGSDVEALAKYGLAPAGRSRFGAYAGLAFANTPAQTGTVLTLGAVEEYRAGSGVVFSINPRAACIRDNTLVGLGAGFRAKLWKQISFVGEYTPVVTGSNTRDTGTGNLAHRDLYSAGLRFSSADTRFQVDLGLTNATGFTTGSSLTPGLRGSGAVFLSVSFKR